MIAAAVRIVAEQGLDNLTLAECGEAAGYSRGLAAHYFGSKEELIVAIATHIVADYTQLLRKANGNNSNGGLEALLDSLSFYIESGRKDLITLRAFHAVLGSALKQSPLSEKIAELNRQSIDSFAARIRHGIARREIRKDVDPVSQAALIVAALRGVMAQALVDPKRVRLDAIKREFLENLRRSLAP